MRVILISGFFVAGPYCFRIRMQLDTKKAYKENDKGACKSALTSEKPFIPTNSMNRVLR